MTEEEKEAIRYIQSEIKDLLNEIRYYKDYENIIQKEELRLKQAILNLIDKLQTKYEKQKRINLEQNQFIDTLKTSIIKLQKENKESKELYNKLLIGYNKLVQEYLELEKVIDLMAEEITYMDYIGERPSKNHIKEKFYKKVEEENEQ